MPRVANFNVVDYYDNNNTDMGVGCTPTSGVLKFQWSLELLENKSMDIQGNYALSGSGQYNWLVFDADRHCFLLQQYSSMIYCYSSVTDVSVGTVYDIEGEFAETGMIITVNGTTDTAPGRTAGSRDFWLFSNGGEHRAIANVRTYSLKVWDNDILIGDFLPVSRKSDNKGGLWNQLNDVVYYPGGNEPFYTDMPWTQVSGELPYNDYFPDMPDSYMTDLPDAFFRIDALNEYPRNNLFEILDGPAVEYPPDAMFRSDSRLMGGIPFEGLFLDVEDLGAFANATELKTIRIPPTVKKIGENAFTHTRLIRVRIANDCECGSETFPPNCEIKNY